MSIGDYNGNNLTNVILIFYQYNFVSVIIMEIILQM